MKALALFLLLLSAPAWADDFKYGGTLNAASGASTNNAAATNTTAAGATAAIGTLGGTTQRPVRLYVQCSVDVRMRTGTDNTVAAALTGANKGLLISAEQLFPLDLRSGWLAIIPATGSGSASCDLFLRS